MNKVKIGIIGAAGYTAGELIRILLNHPNVELTSLQSGSNAGASITDVHQDLVGETTLTFDKHIDLQNVDLIFLCKGHGESAKILKENPAILNKKIVDLSQDFRLKGDHDFVYGLPEVAKAEIQKADHIANPGCFATAIQLGCYPAIKEGLVKGDLHISGITGSTGAGQSLSATSHFSWRSNNATVYKALQHQHLHEVGEMLQAAESGWNAAIQFIPYRGAFTRGIITTSYFDTEASQDELIATYQKAYAESVFTFVVDENPNIKQVVNTNKALVFPKVIDGKGVVVSVIDNLLKGASGQAVQNLNLMMGWDEKTGLNLKSTFF